MISSQALIFEAEPIAIPERKAYVLSILSKANLFLQTSKQVQKMAEVFVNSGIKPLDLLHLAFSVEAKADYFCTCDDKFLRRAKEADTLQTKVVSPLELITELTQ